MSKRERLSEFNRGNILCAAKELFREKGVMQTTVDDIARAADYSKSTIYVYFKSKDEIYNYIILEHITILKNMVNSALTENPNYPDGYYAICDSLVSFYDTYPLYFESILGEIKIPQSCDGDESVLVKIYEVGEEINAIIEGYIDEFLSEKLSGFSMTPLQITFTLWAAIGGIITIANKKEMYINGAMKLSKEQFMRGGFELLLRSISGGC
ncbi:MAG: TetR/AcrR family transcriptional regulator [Oscillospiraceae bacterium]|nr:TetR/AcrR family transcriptional regulator [Oscillospiraceae bacterium]